MPKAMQTADYGIDAPGLLRFFFVAGAIGGILLLAVSLTSLLGGTVKLLACSLLAVASFYLLGMGCFMLFYSKVQKLRDREQLLNLIQWSGSERVLDVGCGRGLMLIGAAKRLTTGKAIGIDLWQQQDQADNSAEATLANARLEGLLERVTVETADMRQLPFPDHHFDVVLSNWAVHNLEAHADRQKALNEMIRVLKPGGRAVLSDITNQSEYASYFQEHGMVNVRLHNKPIQNIVLRAITFGSFAPSAVLAGKPEGGR